MSWSLRVSPWWECEWYVLWYTNRSNFLFSHSLDLMDLPLKSHEYCSNNPKDEALEPLPFHEEITMMTQISCFVDLFKIFIIIWAPFCLTIDPSTIETWSSDSHQHHKPRYQSIELFITPSISICKPDFDLYFLGSLELKAWHFFWNVYSSVEIDNRDWLGRNQEDDNNNTIRWRSDRNSDTWRSEEEALDRG